MRLIDADKFEAFMYQNDNDDFDNGVQFVLEMIDKAPTVCDIEQIRAEIADLDDAEYEFEGYYKAVNDALQIIDKYTNGGMSPEVKEHYEQLAEHYNKKGKKG